MEILQGLLDNLTALLAAHPLAGEWYMAFVRFLFPALAVLILYRAVRSLLRIPHTPENWGQLSLPNGTSLPLTHWENILGRSKTADIYLNYPSISRQHAALCRGEDENWTLYDLGSKGGTAVNGEKVASSVPVKLGDTITLGGVPLIFLPQTVAEREEQEAKRRAERPAAIWPSFLWLTVFQCDYGPLQVPGKPRDTMIGAMREVAAVANAEGVPLSEKDVAAWVDIIDHLPSNGETSMRQDGKNHRKSEVELFAGIIRRLAAKHGISVPVNDWLYQQIQEMERNY